jgi:DNA-binding transcriptional ArsR family regulator
MKTKASPELTDSHIEEIARLFGVLAEPSRLKILRTLMDSPATVSELIEITGMKQGNVSKHLGVLLSARFVARQQSGNFARYSIIDPKLKALCNLMCGRVEEDAACRVRALR